MSPCDGEEVVSPNPSIVTAVVDVEIEMAERKLRPSRCALIVMETMTWVVSVLPGDPRDEASTTASRFLLSILSTDMCAWGVGKFLVLEAVLLAEELEWCYLLTSLVLFTVEVCIEFVGSLLMPVIFVWTERTSDSAYLSKFALKAYWLSNAVGLLLYPFWGLAVHVLGYKSGLMVYVLSGIWSFQYCFLNQVGDQAIQISRPFWMATFRGSMLGFPGRPYAWLRRPATDDTLPSFLVLMRVVWASLMAIIYVTVRRLVYIRWGALLVLLTWNILVSGVLLDVSSSISEFNAGKWAEESSRTNDGTVQETSEKEQSRCFAGSLSLTWSERSWVVFVVLVTGFMLQATDSLTSILLLELPIFVVGGVIAMGVLIVLCVFCVKIHATAHVSSEAKSPKSNFAVEWILPTVFITVLVGGCAVSLALWSSGAYVALGCALIMGVPYRLLSKHIDTFLLLHEQSRSKELVFWQNVLQVASNGPLLVANWATATASGCNGDDGNELVASGAILTLSAGVLLFVLLFYSIVDPWLPRGCSLMALVNDAGSPQG